MHYDNLEIADLLILLENVSPFSEESMQIHDALTEKTEALVLDYFTRNIMPVYRVNDILVLGIHPSAKSYPDGYVQVTRFSLRDGVIGDSQYSSVRSAIQSEGLWHMDLLSDAMAEESLGLTLTAEIAYSSSIGQSSHFCHLG